jgi:hypothetical protein
MQKGQENSNVLNRIQKERDQLIAVHEQILSNSKNSHITSDAAALSSETPEHLIGLYNNLQLVVERQQLKIQELLTFEKEYKGLHTQFEILENTNDKLLQHILLLSDLEETHTELEELVANLRKELKTTRIKFRDVTTQRNKLNQKILVLKSGNEEIAERLRESRQQVELLLQENAYKDEKNKQLVKSIDVQLNAFNSLTKKHDALLCEFEKQYAKK